MNENDSTPNADLRRLVERVRSQSRIFSEGSRERRCLEWAADEIEGEIDD